MTTGLNVTGFVREWINQELDYAQAEAASLEFERSIAKKKALTHQTISFAARSAMRLCSGSLVNRVMVQLEDELTSASWVSISNGKTWDWNPDKQIFDVSWFPPNLWGARK